MQSSVTLLKKGLQSFFQMFQDQCYHCTSHFTCLPRNLSFYWWGKLYFWHYHIFQYIYLHNIYYLKEVKENNSLVGASISSLWIFITIDQDGQSNCTDHIFNTKSCFLPSFEKPHCPKWDKLGLYTYQLRFMRELCFCRLVAEILRG